jgi:hypothetical protein
MAGKPHQSSLIPYEAEIINLRRRRPPLPFTQIADLLRQKYNLVIQAPAIFKFIKVRSRGRKVFSYGRNVHNEKPPSVLPAPQPTNPGSGTQPKPIFDFPYSERYNLHRLPPEVAAARRKKLEEEGH